MCVGFTEAFKLHVVEEVELGRITQSDAGRKYGILGHSTILKWCRMFVRYELVNPELVLVSCTHC